MRSWRRLAALDLDLAFADDVSHFARAAIERLAWAQADAGAALADRHRYPAVFAARDSDARSFRRGLEESLAVHPHRRGSLRALHVAVEARGGRDYRRGGWLVGRPR